MERNKMEKETCSGNNKLGLAMIITLISSFGLLYWYATTLTA